jgi:cyanophycin synthetase
MARPKAIQASARRRITRSEGTVRRTRARLSSRADRIRIRIARPAHVPTGMERNIALLHRAGAELGIEVEELPGGFVRLTLGDREHYGHGSDLDFEPLVPWFVCGDKELTGSILRKHELPVLPSRTFAVDELAEAEAYARTLGGPVVVKPTRNTYGSAGVTLNVASSRQLRSAFARALVYGPSVMVEVQAAGQHLRFTMLAAEVLGVVRRFPAHVVGDGVRSITSLIEAKNRAWREAAPENQLLHPITLDRDVKARLVARGMTVQSVPAAREVVDLREVVTTEHGGEVRDLHDADVHQELVRVAREAARALGPVVCAVDMMAKDPGAPVNGNVVIGEVNTTPGLYVINQLVDGTPSPRGTRRILEHLFELDAVASGHRPTTRSSEV